VRVQRLVSVVKMATVLEEDITEEYRPVVRFFCGQRDSKHAMFIKNYLLFGVGIVYRITSFTPGWHVSLMTKRLKRSEELVEATVKRPICCEFQRTDNKKGQIY
jgi:hypothetical protein